MSNLERSLVAVGAFAVLLFGSRDCLAQSAPAEPLFPRPFVVEHGVIQREEGGAVFEGPKVTDYYGGSWIVSVRPDGARAVVDFARREITDVHPGRGTYSVLGFDRFAELRARLRRAEGAGESQAGGGRREAGATSLSAQPPSFVVEEVPIERQVAAASAQAVGLRASPLQRPGVRHFKVTPKLPTDQASTGRPAPVGGALEVWLDPSVRFEPATLARLASFEAEVLSTTPHDGQVAWSRGLAAAREHAGGAFPIRTLRPLSINGAAARAASLEDVATRLELIERIPADLLTIPDGYRRVAHPLEAMVAFAEEEAARTRKSGPGRTR